MGVEWEAASPSLLLKGKTIGVFDPLYMYQGTPTVPILKLFGRNWCERINMAVCWATHPYLKIGWLQDDSPAWFFCCVQAKSLLPGTHSRDNLAPTISFSISKILPVKAEHRKYRPLNACDSAVTRRRTVVGREAQARKLPASWGNACLFVLFPKPLGCAREAAAEM